MEEADAVDLSKENIQPLKQGRNASILGLALQAQSDEQIHQRLLKMQEAYEMKIRTYNGSDPLELWVEYIFWVEQSFPKHGLEGNLEVLLQKCFTALKDEERYKQDPRFVKLWIKFIDMQTTDRLEVYRFLSGQGIGTACSEFYRSWAYEFEQMEDYKHADAVYQLAYTNMAQPAAELEAAHTQFQLRVARAVLNNQASTAHETAQSVDVENQRSAMASLCPVGPKQNKAATVRVGSNVLSVTPGTFPNPSSSHYGKMSLLGPSNATTDRIQIYQEDSSDSVGVLGKGHAHAPSTSVHRYRNKENSMGPGTWNKPGAVRPKVPPHVAVYQPQQAGPSFEVHRDEASDSAPVTPSLKTFTPNVLKPRKLEENPVKETLAVYDQPDSSVKVMYPKDKVYGGGKELQLEEIMAIEHWKEKAKDSGGLVDPVEQERIRLEEMKREIEEKLKLLNRKSVAPQPVPNKVEEAPQPAATFASSSVSQPISTGLAELVNSAGFVNRSENAGQESGSGFSARGDNCSSNSLNVLLTPGDAPSHLANSSNGSELSLEKKKVAFGSGGRGHTSIYNQSITVHTKLAMREVDDLWRSPNPTKFADPESPAVIPAREALPQGSELAFDICRDETDVIRPPPQSRGHFPQSSGLKGLSVTDDASAEPGRVADQFHILPDDPDESLARVLGPNSSSANVNIFKEPLAAAFRGSLKKGPTEKVADENRGVLSSEHLSVADVQMSKPDSDQNGFLETLQRIPLVATSQEMHPTSSKADPQANEFPIFGDNAKHGAEFAGFEFNVFVDEHETKHTQAAATAVLPVTPANKLNVIAKEKENAQKFSHVEIEEIVKKPKMAPSRRSILPQLNHFSDACPPKDNMPKKDLPQEYPEDDDTCSTKVFSGGFLVASTPFSGSIVRSKVPECDFESRELNGSIFVNPSSDEVARPISTGALKDTLMDGNQLSTIYEVSSSSNRTGSSQSAASGTASNGITDQEGAFVSTQPNLNMIDEENEDISTDCNEPYHHDVTVCINGEVDPFDKILVHDLLKKHHFPQAHHKDGLSLLSKSVPVKRNNNFVIENETFKIIRQLGEGAYAKVWEVVEESTKRHVALKIQKPSWQWEFYICREIQFRLQNKDLASSFMHAEKVYLYNNGSVLLTEVVQYGSLLDLANKLTQSLISSRKEAFVFIMADHLLRVVEALHSCDIIHGDLKPDNVLIRTLPRISSRDSCLILIDFGRSIDMSLFPPGTTFQRNVKTDGFACVEMQTNRPWTYQTDLYGLASSVHCLINGNYMRVREVSGRWQIQQTIPRSFDKERWTKFFSALLNVESCNAMPDLKSIREDLLDGVCLRSREFDDFYSILKS